jgi:alkylation response protein AidB-like acyl-CoA dehydrogenase
MAALSEEQTMIRDQAKSWTTGEAPVKTFRALRDSGDLDRFSQAPWRAMADMGWTGILVPEEYGGSNLGLLTFGLVLQETGRQLTASPLLMSGLVGVSALLLGGNDEQKQAWLPAIIDGSAILTLAVDEQPRHNPQHIGLRAERDGDNYLLNGAKTFVPEGGIATDVVVAARTSGNDADDSGITLFLVPAAARGLDRKARNTVDSRGYADLAFDNVSVGAEAVLGTADDGRALLDAILDRARAGISAEMFGTACQAFDMTLDYLKTREQFGKPIGSFQALGHRAADLFSEMELAHSCLEAALTALDNDAEDSALLVSLAKCKVGDFMHHVSNELIQIHGGIGMTDELDAGLYLKRARAVEAAWGNQAWHVERFARLSGF